MAARKRTIISVERNCLTVVRPPGESIDRWCDECSATVAMVTPEHAASLCDQAPRAIYRMVESGELHFVETDDGTLLVCRNALKEHFAEANEGRSVASRARLLNEKEE